MKRYEGMFLFDNATVQQWSEIEAEVRRLCDRIQADLLVCLKFDERRLAYEIKGRKRGTYVLTYFHAEPDHIVELERDARLSEVILRTLLLRADHISEERLAELKALPPDQPLQPIGGDGRRGEGGSYRDRRETSTASGGGQTAAATTAAAMTKSPVEDGGAVESAPAAPTPTASPPAPEPPESKPADE